jgi:hypothetical protein
MISFHNDKNNHEKSKSHLKFTPNGSTMHYEDNNY